MPIVFIHGVATRDESPDFATTLEERVALLRRYVAPAIAPDPEHVRILPVYWGQHGARFAFGRKSRPRTPLLGQGATGTLSLAETATAAASLQDVLYELDLPPPTQAKTHGLIASGPADQEVTSVRIADLTAEELSGLLVQIARQTVEPKSAALAVLAADAVAMDPATGAALAAAAGLDDELALLEQLVAERYAEEQARVGGLLAMGGPGWVARFRDAVGEALRRTRATGGFLLARAAVETVRRPLNDLVTLFIGDVFTYLANRTVMRDGAEVPGPIPQAALDALAEAHADKLRRDEPLVVLSHSMGGQIIYDLVTSFLPSLPQYQHIRVDFWCATASQVGLFEELKLFRASSQAHSDFMGRLVPFPDRLHLGEWWNVWDHNDVISYTVRGIFVTRPEHPDGVDDGPYDAGMFIGPSHGGYLEQPSFYRLFADKLRAAAALSWRRPDAPGR